MTMTPWSGLEETHPRSEKDMLEATSDGTERSDHGGPSGHDGAAPSQWRRIGRFLWRPRFLYVQVAILAAVVWILLPLRDASMLPHPSWPPYTPEPPDLQQTLVLGPDRLAAGSQGAVRVIVYDPRSGRPIPGAQVRIALAPQRDLGAMDVLFTGQTDAQGTANVVFPVPGDGTCGSGQPQITPARDVQLAVDCAFVVETAGQVGAQRVVRTVRLEPANVLGLLTDREFYQPGERMRFRFQATNRMSGWPIAGEQITITVAEAQGHLVWTQTMTTSLQGLAFAEFELAPQVNPGPYRVQGVMEGVVVERTVHVQSRSEPPFGLDIQTIQPYYIITPCASQRIEGAVHAAYRWGEPLAGAQIEIFASGGAAGAPQASRARGETNEDGVFSFAANLCDALEIARPSAPVSLTLIARVMDADGHIETDEKQISVAEQPIHIQAAPEGEWPGVLKPGLENLVSLHTSYPDGQPAQCALTIEAPGWVDQVEMQTDGEGYAEIRLLPDAGEVMTLTIAARDGQGQEGVARFEIPIEKGDGHLLLRPQQRAYRAGEPLQVAAFVSYAAQAVYLDVIQEGQSVAVYAAPVVDRVAHLDLELADDLFGTLELHAFSILPDGTLIRDARLVRVDSPHDVQVALQLEQDRYAPGDTARVNIRAVDVQGRAMPSALSVAVWADGRSAMEREAAGTSVSEAQGVNLEPQGSAAELAPLYAEQASKPRPMPDPVRRQFEDVESTRAARQRAFTAQAGRVMRSLIAVPVFLWIVVLTLVRKNHIPGLALRRALGSLLGGVFVLPFVLGGAVLLVHLGQTLFGPGAMLVLGIAWLATLLALFVYAWTRGGGWVQLVFVLLVGYLVLAAGLYYATIQGAEPGPVGVTAGLVALVAALVALHVSGVEWAGRGERLGGLAAWTLLLLLPTTLFGTVLSGSGVTGATDEWPISQPIQTTPESGEPLSGDTPVAVTPTATPFIRPVATPQPTRSTIPFVPSVPGEKAFLSQAPFAQTMYWLPNERTDARGNLTVEFPLVGTGSSWHLIAIAATEKGGMGVAEKEIEVLEPLRLEVALPTRLTVGDVLDVPIVVYNAAPVSRTVYVTVSQGTWFRQRISSANAQQVEVAPHNTGVLYLPISVVERGTHTLEVVAQSDQGSETLSLPVEVQPDGLLYLRAYGGQVGQADAEPPEDADELADRYKFRVPWSAIPGSDHVTVKLYPNWASILEEGLDGLLDGTEHAAGVSFDQAVHIARARVLREAYEHYRQLPGDGGQGEAGLAMRAEAAHDLSMDYQQLLTFWTADGGFSAFGRTPPDPVQTANGLLALSEMGRLGPIDPALPKSAVLELLRQQTVDGAWPVVPLPPSWQGMPGADLPLTAYVTWALAEAGYGNVPEVQLAVQHLEQSIDQAQDPYVLGLVVHALMACAAQEGGQASIALGSALDRLAEMAEVTDGMAVWRGEIETLDGAIQDSAGIERTALATWALLRANVHREVAVQGLATLAARRDAFGTWGSPQATWWALQAFWTAVQQGEPSRTASDVSVTVDQVTAQPVTVDAAASGEIQALAFDQLSKGYNDVEVLLRKGTTATYQVVGTYYLPWKYAELPAAEEEEISLDLGYDRTRIEVGQTLAATVAVKLNRAGVARMVVVELGLPPGLEVLQQDWEDLVKQGIIAGYAQEGEQIRVYLAHLAADKPVQFGYRLRARFPLWVRTQPTRAYDLANALDVVVREPVAIEVVRPGT